MTKKRVMEVAFSSLTNCRCRRRRRCDCPAAVLGLGLRPVCVSAQRVTLVAATGLGFEFWVEGSLTKD